MRILVMATGRFAVPTFRALLESDHEVVGVVTRPVRTAVRGKQPPPNPMVEVTSGLELPLFMPEGINDASAIPMLENARADLFFVCDYGQILSAGTLELARLGGINLHGSWLPEYRGAAPVNWAIYDGRTETGVSVIHMTPRLDAGPILVQERCPIGPNVDAVELETQLALIGREVVLRAIAMLEQWDGTSPLGVAQDTSQATRAPRLKKADGTIDWQRSATEICNQVRAFKPWPGSFTFWQRENKSPVRLVLEQVSAGSEVAMDGLGNAAPGTILQADESLVVATGDGILHIECLQPAGKKSMRTEEFLCGNRIAVGDRLTS